MAKRIDARMLVPIIGTLHPPPFDLARRAHERKRLGDAAGLKQLGADPLCLPSGAWLSQRHWHTSQDEFVYVLVGEVVLVIDGRKEVLRQGHAARFPENKGKGHSLQNRSGADAQALDIGTRPADDTAYYSSIGMMAPAGGRPPVYTHRDGAPYAGIRCRGLDVWVQRCHVAGRR